MEDINIKEIINFYLKNIIPISVITSLFIIGSFFYGTYYQKPQYKSSATLLLANEQTVITQGDITLNRSLINTYREIIKSNKVLEKTIKKLNITKTKAELSQMIEVNSINNTDVIKITITSGKARETHIIANQLSEMFIETVEELYNIENVSIIDRAEYPKTAFNINPNKQTIMAMMLGLFTSISIFTAIYVLDDTIKGEKELEYILNVPVIGVVPLDKEGKKNAK